MSESEHVRCLQEMDEAKVFLESLQAFNTPGKMKNFRYSSTEVRQKTEGLDTLEDLRAIQKTAADLAPLAGYLSQAQMALPADHPLLEKMHERERPAPGLLDWLGVQGPTRSGS